MGIFMIKIRRLFNPRTECGHSCPRCFRLVNWRDVVKLKTECCGIMPVITKDLRYKYPLFKEILND